MTSRTRRAFEWAELPARQDINVWEGTTRWGNHDLYPIPKKEQTYRMYDYFSYYLVSGVTISGFTASSAYVTAGLGVWETIGAVMAGTILAGMVSWLGGQAGAEKRLGFTMMTRVTFGLWGQCLALVVPLIGNVIFVSLCPVT